MTLSILFRLSIFLLILFLVDWYAFQAIRTVFRSALWVRTLYWAFSISVYLALSWLAYSFDRSEGPHNQFQFILALTILSLVPKLIVLIMMLGEDIVRVISGSIRKLSGSEEQFLPDRRRFVSQAALILAAIPFAGILHGVWRGRYNYRVLRKTLVFEDLPAAFDGLTITQISDVHSGSFDNADKINYAIDLINEQKSDLLLFTGDLVNNKAEEMEPWIDSFARLQAPMGKFSVLGNHDYGDYINWPSMEAKRRNMKRLYDIHSELGFRLLNNDSISLKKEGQKINLVGVENWGAGGFVKHGDLEKATEKVGEQEFNILMSHDPSHFDAVVKSFPTKMHLTLSGHTHGMQFGIEIPGWIKWSPVKYRYPKWAGLYEEAGRKLYVNRGFGFLAFPGRVGIWPEVTVFTLRKTS